MTTAEAVALYRAEKRAALSRGVDLARPHPILETLWMRRPAINMRNGHAWSRDDAFVVKKPR